MKKKKSLLLICGTVTTAAAKQLGGELSYGFPCILCIRMLSFKLWYKN